LWPQVPSARIAATDEHPISTVTSHVGQQQGLVVEQKVRDCPGHRLKVMAPAQVSLHTIGSVKS
jgi:hypothetical protein